MGRQVIWANVAEADLDAAAEYIHRDSPAYAATFVLRALKAGRSLSDFAERGRTVPEFKVSGNWRIFFKFFDGDAYVVDYDDYH